MNLRVSFVFVLSLLLCFAGRSAMAVAGPDLSLQGGKVHPSPTANPIDDAVVLIRNGRIIVVAKRSELNIPKRRVLVGMRNLAKAMTRSGEEKIIYSSQGMLQ